jgi:hypothetical protein
LLLVLAACEQPMPGSGRSERDVDDLTLDDLPDRVEGTLAGESFDAADAYFRVFHAGGGMRVDLVFAEETVDECGLPLPREGRRVFVRFDDQGSLTEGETIVDRDDASNVSVHYERSIDGRWVGVGDGVARIALDDVERSRVRGRFHACFDDGDESCVAGELEARRCASRLNGDLPREGTGVSDPPTAEEVAP